jgi:hypothetical protein
MSRDFRSERHFALECTESTESKYSGQTYYSGYQTDKPIARKRKKSTGLNLLLAGFVTMLLVGAPPVFTYFASFLR